MSFEYSGFESRWGMTRAPRSQLVAGEMVVAPHPCRFLLLLLAVISVSGCTVDKCVTSILAPTQNIPQCIQTKIP